MKTFLLSIVAVLTLCQISEARPSGVRFSYDGFCVAREIQEGIYYLENLGVCEYESFRDQLTKQQNTASAKISECMIHAREVCVQNKGTFSAEQLIVYSDAYEMELTPEEWDALNGTTLTRWGWSELGAALHRARGNIPRGMTTGEFYSDTADVGCMLKTYMEQEFKCELPSPFVK